MGTEVTAGGFGPVTFNKQVPAHLRTASPPREARLFSPNPRLAYQHTNLYVGASPSFDSPPAPLGVTHDASATQPATSTTAPPCPSSLTRRTRGTGRAVAYYEAGFVSRFVVVASSPVVCLGLLQNSQTASGTVVVNKHTQYRNLGFVSMFRRRPGLGRSAFTLH